MVSMERARPDQSRRALEALSGFFTEPRERGAQPGHAEWLALFHAMAHEVPAYARFLRQHAIDPAHIHDVDALRRVPPTTKDNYHRTSPLSDLCRHGRLEACDMIALSTGSTGEPTVWPRFVADELGTARRFEQVLVDGFELDRRRTLGVVCFALGNWVGGIYTLSCCRQLAAKGYPLTLAAPGNNKPEILRVLRALRGSFDQVVLFGYPPFIKDVIDAGVADGFDWSLTPTRIVLAGEVFSEAWRTLVCQRLGVSDPARSSASLYGTADGGVLANETPLSIRIRRALSARPDAARALFGEARLPTLCQYDPTHRYFEAEDGALLFSGDSGVPLMRYEILDRGGVIPYGEMRTRLLELGVELEPGNGAPERELPFVYVFGRSSFAVSFYGANVYPENVAVGLEQPELAPFLTGKFVLEVTHDEQQDAVLSLAVELCAGGSPSAELASAIARSVRAHVERQNSEFANYAPAERRTPVVRLMPFAEPQYFPPGVKHRYTRG
ncbi:MAG: phenylacetate--CoA ligase family protein [Polyangiaceae bacterium]